MTHSDEPLFSVITVCYNDLAGLRRTVDATSRQVDASFEHLVIDGGSDDGTSDFLQSNFGASNQRWISEADGGIYDAMNKGAALASGSVLVFMNAGDVFTDHRVLNFVAQSFLVDGWQWAFGCVRLIDRDGVICGYQIQQPYQARKIQLGRAFVPHQAAYVTRSLFEKLGGFRMDVGVSGDQEFLMRAGLTSSPVEWMRFLADFEVGGAHSQSSENARQWRWHHMRVRFGLPYAGSNSIDSLYTATYGGYLQVRSYLRTSRNFLRRSVASRRRST